MVYHILADGTVTKDISGRVVKMSEAENLYQLMRNIKTRKNKEAKNEDRR